MNKSKFKETKYKKRRASYLRLQVCSQAEDCLGSLCMSVCGAHMCECLLVCMCIPRHVCWSLPSVSNIERLHYPYDVAHPCMWIKQDLSSVSFLQRTWSEVAENLTKIFTYQQSRCYWIPDFHYCRYVEFWEWAHKLSWTYHSSLWCPSKGSFLGPIVSGAHASLYLLAGILLLHRYRASEAAGNPVCIPGYPRAKSLRNLSS